MPNVIDVPYFSPATETRMLQLADFVANAVWRYYEHGVTMDINKIKHLFSIGTEGWPVPGFNHLTKDKNCKCIACTFKIDQGLNFP